MTQRLPETATDGAAQEAQVLHDLAPPLDLGAGQLLGVGGVDVRDPGHVDHHDPVLGGPVPGALDPGEPVAARVGRLAHERPEIKPARAPRRAPAKKVVEKAEE